MDFIGGLTAVLGLMVALHDARRTATGRDVDVDLYRSSLAMLTYQAAWFLSAGVPAQRHSMSAHPSIVPFQFFETADGYIAVACGKERFFTELVARLGLTDVAGDKRFADFAGRREFREELLNRLAEEFRRKPSQEWVRLLRGAVPVAPVRSMEEALDRAEVSSRDMLATYESPALGDVSALGTPIKLGGYTPEYTAAPTVGEHNDDLLTQLGYTAAQVADLRKKGAFGKHTS